MPNEPNSISSSDFAIRYLTGELSEDARVEFERSIANGENADAAKFLSPVLKAIVDASKPIEPSPAIRAKVMQAIGEEYSNKFTNDYFVQRDDASHWEDFGVPGVTMRMLFVDRENRTKKFLVRMQPGCEIPEHPHDDDEECFIIEGDLRSDELVLMPGDFMRAPAGSHHGRLFSKTGCLMLVTAGLDEHELN